MIFRLRSWYFNKSTMIKIKKNAEGDLEPTNLTTLLKSDGCQTRKQIKLIWRSIRSRNPEITNSKFLKVIPATSPLFSAGSVMVIGVQIRKLNPRNLDNDTKPQQ